MARRRINLPFLGILLLIVSGIAVAAVVAARLLHRADPQQYIAAAHQYEQQQQWDQAATALARAIQLVPKDASLRVEAGKDLVAQAAQDPDKWVEASNMWRTAVEVDPSNAEARQLLLTAYESDLDKLEQAPKTDKVREQLTSLFQAVSDQASQLQALNPKNVDVRTVIPALNIRLWLMNIPIPLTPAEGALPYDKRPTDDQKVAAAIATLSSLLHDDPTNSEAGVWIARAKIHQAQLAQQNQAAQQSLIDATTLPTGGTADALFAQAAGVFDQAIAQRPTLAKLYDAKAQVLATILNVDTAPEPRAREFAALRDALDHAQSLVDIHNTTQWLDIKSQWAHLLSMTDRSRAESVYRDVMAKMPGEVMPRVALAQLLEREPGRQNDALALLEALPDQPPVDMPPSRRALMANALLEAKVVRTQVLTDELRETSDPAQRAALAGQAQAMLDQLNPRLGQTWQFLKLQGSLQLAQGAGHYRDAAQTLDAAVSKMKLQTTGVDPELLLLEADAYQYAGQDGDAATVLEQAMSYPQVNQQLRPHEVLANLYIKAHNTERASQHLDWLVSHAPDDPDVIKLQIDSLDPVANPVNKPTAEALFARLPEKTPAQMAEKATIAQQRLGDLDQAQRLYKAMLQADPGNLPAATNLALLYANSGNAQQANDVLNAARKIHPDDHSLALLSQAIAGATPQALAAAKAQMIRQETPDPFTRELRLAELSGSVGDRVSQLLHLKNAQSYDASNPKVLEPLFQLYLAQRRFDDARPLLDPLSKADADSAHGGLLRFKFDLAVGDKQAALNQAQALVAEFPQFSNAWLALGDALADLGRYDDASSKYLQAMDKQGSDPSALRGLINCSYAVNKLDDAKRYIEEARQQFPTDPAFRDMEVQHELRYGDPDSVIPSLLDQVKQHPDQQQSYRLAADALARSAAIKAEHADVDGANQRLAQAHDLLVQATARWPDEVAFAAALSQNCVQQQDMPGAEAALTTLAARPMWQGQPAPQVALADMYIAARRSADAEAPLRLAMSRMKDPVPVAIKLAQVLQSEHKLDEALAVLDADRSRPDVINERSNILIAMNRAPQAEAELVAALGPAANPAAPATRPVAQTEPLDNILASIYFREGKLAETTALTNSLLAADPTDVTAHYYRAVANLGGRKPDADAAIADLSVVRDRQPDLIDARIGLANAFALKNDSDSAIHELESAEHSVPGNVAVRLRLAQLYADAAPARLIEAQQVLSEAMAMPLNKNDVSLLRALAIVQAKRGQSDSALATIRQAMTISHNDPELDKDYLHILLLNKDYPLLITEADTLTAVPGGGPWFAYDYRARAKNQSGDRDGAIKDFDLAMRQSTLQGAGPISSGVALDAAAELGLDQAIALVDQRDSNDTRWKLIALVLYERKGDHATALKIAESVMAAMDTLSYSEQDELLDEAGSLYLSVNPPLADKAAAVYRQVLQRHPDDVFAMNNLACVLADDLHQPQQALPFSTEAYNAVLRSGRVQPLIYDTQGWVLILNGQVDQGIDVLQKIGDSADFADLHYHMGQGYLRKRLPQSAEHELQTASDMLDQATVSGQTTASDPALREKVTAAMKQVQAMTQDKTQVQAMP
jgi:tetratricopeptide (TPR) repeat protein